MNTTLTQCQQETATCEPKVRTFRPKADVYETDDAWLLALDLPGADETTTDISFEKHVLTVTANVEQSVPEGFQCTHSEFPSRKYERAFRLPDEVDSTAIEATVKNGVLRLTLPKSKEARPHQVVVKGG